MYVLGPASLVVGLALALSASAQPVATSYSVDDSAGPARTFDGVGGLSGGGATSVLLRDYPEPARSTILDLLFKPNFGASLSILKVEIGGDSQSTDGSESSHMHDPWTTDYTRGYEWFLIQQAKLRNPDILLYGLPWAFPQHVSCNAGSLVNCTNNPYSHPQQTADYITSWVHGAKSVYNADIDYIGSWNERGYDIPYLETLRHTLDAAGFAATKIVAPDSGFSIAKDILDNPTFAASIWGLGAHYPNMQSGALAEATGKPLWASEEDSTYNSGVGAGCWARVINQNYVRGNMTASINWNLISSYMKGTNWWRAGLMTAYQPWGGHFGSLAMIWATAHTTQFAKAGSFSYLLNGTGAGTGSGLLAHGGSYVTLENFASGDFSIVIEKMTRDHSPCCRPGLPAFSTAPEQATFHLAGAPAKATTLQVWRTHWSFGAPGDRTTEFELQTSITVAGGAFSILIEQDSVYTITTLTTGNKGIFAEPPPHAVFPTTHVDDFESCAASAEAPYFSDQNGIFECQPKSADPAHGVVMRQMVPLQPVTWGGDIRPHSLLGSRDLVNTSFSVDVRLTSANGSFLLGARLAGTTDSGGIVFAVDVNGDYNITQSMSHVTSGPPKAFGQLNGPLGVDTWHRLRLDVNGSVANLWVDGHLAVPNVDVSWAGLSGHSGVGTVQFGHYSELDNIELYSTHVTCSAAAPAAGAPIAAVSCESEVGRRPGGQVLFTPTTPASCPNGSPCAGAQGTFSLATDATLCFAVTPGGAHDDWPIALARCDATSPNQVFTQAYTMLYQSSIVHTASSRTVCLASPDIGALAYAHTNGGPATQCGDFVFEGSEQEIVSINSMSVCLGVC